MPRFSTNLSFMFDKVPFLDRFEAAAKAGFKAVEFLSPLDHGIEDIRARLKGNGLELDLFNAAIGDYANGERGIAGIPGREKECQAAIQKCVTYAEALGCRKLHVMAGYKSSGADRETFIANLRHAARTAGGIDLMLEPINTRDMPTYLLNHCRDARAIIEEIGTNNIKLQFDVYHRQIVEGDIAGGIKEFADITAHYQIANPPDRGEPDSGELNYASIFEMIDATGYKGWVGCEYKPRAGTVPGLAWTKRLGVALGS